MPVPPVPSASRRPTAIAEAVGDALDAVRSLDHDRIIRALLAIIQAGLRTNYYQSGTDGIPKPYLSLKLDPKSLPDLPAPRPMFEIWVYSPRVEAVHMRIGRVARGGLRWSDRREDFRTEILGLVKAQMVKNAVTVPTGAKGGFFPKALPDPDVDRDAWLAEGIASYRWFISGMLDLTDNRNGTELVPPERRRLPRPARLLPGRRCRQGHRRLLGHRQRGRPRVRLLARRRVRLRRIGRLRPQGHGHHRPRRVGVGQAPLPGDGHRHPVQDFTVVGIGDMSGDVFGNGMLLSEHIRLVAAFDHRHVFVDPTPVAAPAHAERRRLFDLPRSSWADYDRSLISAGGGVFDRSAKSIAADPRDDRGPRPAQGQGEHDAGRAHPCDPARAGRPAVERRDRHLRQGRDRDQRRGRRPGQRRDPGQRIAVALHGGRRGRQPRAAPSSGGSRRRSPGCG